jgi:phosphoglycolate phosphatase
VLPALIFDLDGTLIDSLPGIAASLNHALADRGLPVHPLPAVRSFIGNGSLELARRSLPPGSPDSLAPQVEAGFRQHYAAHWPSGTFLYPGIAAMVRDLAAAGHPLAVLSNKPHPFTVEIVRHFFPDEPFDEVLGHAPEHPRKPAPDSALQLLARWGVRPRDARFVGDSTVDRETAGRAGIPFIGVAWGYHPPDALGPTVLDTPEDLDGIIA